MVSERRSPGYRTHKIARIVRDGGENLIKCSIRDLSDIGAALAIPREQNMPKTFDLLCENSIVNPARRLGLSNTGPSAPATYSRWDPILKFEAAVELLARRQKLLYTLCEARERLMESGEKKLLIYFEDEEHIVRRLGAAVISCWDEVPRPIQAMLVERATRVLDADETGEFDKQLKNFIKQHTKSR